MLCVNLVPRVLIVAPRARLKALGTRLTLCNHGNKCNQSEISKMAVESEEDDVVIRMINSASALRSETLDLGAKCIYEMPKEILNLNHLEVG